MPITSYFTMDGTMVGEKTDFGPNIGYVPDALGSIVKCIDENGATTYTGAYKPYGDPLATTGTAPRFTYVGTLGYNAAAGVTYAEAAVGARIYSSQLAQWTSVDKLWPDQAAYIYGRQSPTLIVDPLGTLACGWCPTSRTDSLHLSKIEFPPVCQCKKSGAGSVMIMAYKYVSFGCTAVREGDCDCDLNQWKCGSVSVDGIDMMRQQCPDYVPDGDDPSCVTPNSIACSRSITPGGKCQNNVSMTGVDAPGYVSVIGDYTCNGKSGCPFLSNFGFSPSTRLTFSLEYKVSFKTCCGCPPCSNYPCPDYGPGSGQKYDCVGWNFDFDVSVDNAYNATWKGECKGIGPAKCV